MPATYASIANKAFGVNLGRLPQATATTRWSLRCQTNGRREPIKFALSPRGLRVKPRAIPLAVGRAPLQTLGLARFRLRR